MKLHQTYLFEMDRVERRPIVRERQAVPCDGRTRDFEKGRSREVIVRVVGIVATIEGVPAADIITRKRAAAPGAAFARSFSMALCQALKVPGCHVARAFNKTWATVYSAEVKAAARYKAEQDFRKKWNRAVREFGKEEKP